MAYVFDSKELEGLPVVHPLDDLPEAKCDVGRLGPINMTRSVRVSLLALRGYLVVMALLVLYHFLSVARLF